jgi:poly(A) polymerase
MSEGEHRSDAAAAAVGNPGELVHIPPVAARLGEVFASAGHQLFLVGGPVRDALMGRPVNDLDFTTDARPEQVLTLVSGLASGTWTTGIEFGTVGAQIDGQPCEITTFRADSYDRVSRNPVVEFGTDIAEDLRRRDFTMNAMAVSVVNRGFVDPYGGLADLARGVLRTPATPRESFGDDPLRMLRAARFVAQLGVTPAEPVIAAIREMAGELSRITVERVQAELNKLIAGSYPRRGLEVLVDSRIWCCAGLPCCTTSASPRPGGSPTARAAPSW